MLQIKIGDNRATDFHHPMTYAAAKPPLLVLYLGRLSLPQAEGVSFKGPLNAGVLSASFLRGSLIFGQQPEQSSCFGSPASSDGNFGKTCHCPRRNRRRRHRHWRDHRAGDRRVQPGLTTGGRALPSSERSLPCQLDVGVVGVARPLTNRPRRRAWRPVRISPDDVRFAFSHGARLWRRACARQHRRAGVFSAAAGGLCRVHHGTGQGCCALLPGCCPAISA